MQETSKTPQLKKHLHELRCQDHAADAIPRGERRDKVKADIFKQLVRLHKQIIGNNRLNHHVPLGPLGDGLTKKASGSVEIPKP